MARDISVIVPVYNTGQYLRSCIDSIIMQTVFDRMEIILVDDGSTDNSAELCDQYAAEHDKILVIHQKNAGVSAARNSGIEKAVGTYIGFIDSDDYVYPEMYEKLVNLAETTDADMSFCGLMADYPDGRKQVRYPFRENIPIKKDEIKNTVAVFMLRDGSFNSCCNKIFRRDIVSGNRLRFVPGKKQGEDREFLLRFLACAQTVCYARYCGYFYRRVPSGAVQSPNRDAAESILSQYKLDFELFEKIGLSRGIIGELNTVKLMEQAAGALSYAVTRLKGKYRRDAVKNIMFNAEIRGLLNAYRKALTENSSRLNRYICFCIRGKSVIGLRAVLFAMKIKLSLPGTANKGEENER